MISSRRTQKLLIQHSKEMATVNSLAGSVSSTVPDSYYRKLCIHAEISQCNTPLPEALSSLDDTGRWRNLGPDPVEMRTLFLGFRSLHHMNLVHIQDQLARECKETIGSKTTTAAQLERIMLLPRDHGQNISSRFQCWLIFRNVAEAIRNWDATLIRHIARNHFGPNETWRAGSTYRFLSPWDNPVTSRVGARIQRILRRKIAQQLWQRFLMAICGRGCFACADGGDCTES
jgi:hypothetical protein